MKKHCILILALLFILSACEKNKRCDILNYTYYLPAQLEADHPYIKLYTSDADFFQGAKPLIVTDSTDALKIQAAADHNFLPVLDIRRSDGTNSWSDQQALSQLADQQVFFEACRTEVHYPDVAALINAVSSSPTYLHLVLRDVEQDGGSKTWGITRIYDEDRAEVTNRPEWACIRHLLFTFYKGGKGAKIRIATANGQSPCGVFEELFNGTSAAYATYSLEGEDQNELRITAPAISDALKEQLTFQVIRSSYEQLDISLTNADGQIGYTTLTPVSDEE